MDAEGWNDRGSMEEEEPGVPPIVQSAPAELYAESIYELPC